MAYEIITFFFSNSIIIQQQFAEKRSGGGFGQFENGATHGQHITRTVSGRIHQKGPSLVGKRLAKDSWHEAADKVRVNILLPPISFIYHFRQSSVGFQLSFFSLCFLISLICRQFANYFRFYRDVRPFFGSNFYASTFRTVSSRRIYWLSLSFLYRFFFFNIFCLFLACSMSLKQNTKHTL